MSQKEEEQWFKEIMQSAEQTIQNPSFEDQVMKQLMETQKINKGIIKYKRLAWYMLAIGVLIGLVLPVILTSLFSTRIPIEINRMINPSLALLSVFMLSLFGVLLWDRKISKGKHPSSNS